MSFNNTTSAENGHHTESESGLRKLEFEFYLLSKSGEDPARLWRLREELDRHYLVALNEVLARFRAEGQDISSVFQQIEALLLPLELAINRTDLTVPELFFLRKAIAETVELQRQFVLEHRNAIGRRLQVGAYQ